MNEYIILCIRKNVDYGMHHKKIIIGQGRIIFVVSFVLFLGKKIVYCAREIVQYRTVSLTQMYEDLSSYPVLN